MKICKNIEQKLDTSGLDYYDRMFLEDGLGMYKNRFLTNAKFGQIVSGHESAPYWWCKTNYSTGYFYAIKGFTGLNKVILALKATYIGKPTNRPIAGKNLMLSYYPIYLTGHSILNSEVNIIK